MLKVSIIVCTYSLGRLIDTIETVNSLLNQTYAEKEIIVSVDNNRKLYSKLKSILPSSVYLILSTEKGNSATRNAGIIQSTGDIVAFIDDDAIADPFWLETMVNTYCEDEDIGAVTGEIIPLWKDNSINWLPKDFWWIIGCSFQRMPKKKREVRNGIGTNISFKKKLLNEIGLFNPHTGKRGEFWITGDDTEMCIRLKRKTNKKIIYNADVKVKHKVYPHRLFIKNIIKRAFYEGCTKALLKSIYGSEALSTEHNYLTHLLTNAYPVYLKKIIYNPKNALKKIALAITVLFSVASGYFLYNIMKDCFVDYR